jgi:hypothetical protein
MEEVRVGREPQKDSSEEPTPRSDHGYVNLGSGWRRPSDEFGCYGEAFHRAAKELTRVLAEDRAYDPFDAFPIVFLYRHATELYLKGVLRAGEFLLSLKGRQATFDSSALMSHPLRPLLIHLRELFVALDWAESYEDIASFVESLDQMDPNSFAFRYPVNKKNDDALPKSFVLDVLAFARAADSCLETLYNASYSIDDLTESAKAELSDSADAL